MEIIVSQFIGFIIGIFSSWVFWYYLVHVKPKIEISHSIVYNPNSKTLHVKIRNARRRQVTDVQASLAVIEEEPNGRLQTLHIAKLNRDTLFALAPIQDLKKRWSIPATTVFSTNDGEQMLSLLTTKGNGERRIVFVLAATDGLSGTKVVQQVVYRLEDIRYGKFGLGFLVEEISNPTNKEDNELVVEQSQLRS